MIEVTVFLSTLNQTEFHLDQNRLKNCDHDHIPFNVKGKGNIVFSVYNTLGDAIQMEFHLVQIESKTVTTIISHSM